MAVFDDGIAETVLAEATPPELMRDTVCCTSAGEKIDRILRPDKHIGWPSMSVVPDPVAALRSALTSRLARG